MRIGMPEILAAGSVVLLSTGNATVGWVFLGLAVLGSAMRWGVEIQTAQQAQAAKEKEGEERLYTRGNGKEGQDISSLIKYIIWKGKDESKISFTENVVLRGEIIIKPNVFKEKYEKDFANPRNFVSGIVNKKTIDPNVLIDLDFIPYEVIEPKMKPSIAMNYIQ